MQIKKNKGVGMGGVGAESFFQHYILQQQYRRHLMVMWKD